MKSQIRFPIIINLRRGEQLQRNDQIPYIPLDTQRSLEQHPTIVSLGRADKSAWKSAIGDKSINGCILPPSLSLCKMNN